MPLVFIISLFVLIILIISMHNGLIAKKNDVENAFGGMDVQLKKRFDLLPNLVQIVKQYMTHEKELLSRVTELRSRAFDSKLDNKGKVDVDNKMSREIENIMFNIESYPNLKSNAHFINLQKSFNETESQISAARRAYNTAVTDYNNSVQMFPSNMIASMMGLKKMEIFNIPKVERQNVSVADIFNKK